jgi:hypothetical protein
LYDIKDLRAHDVVSVKFLYMGELYEIQGPVTLWWDGHVNDVKVGSVWLTVQGKVPADIIEVSIVKRAPVTEPAVGSIVQCDGCGTRHFRVTRKDGDTPDPKYCWVSEDTGNFFTWEQLQRKDGCGRVKVIYKREYA